MEANAIPIKQANEAGAWYTHRWPWLLAAGPAAVVVAASFTAYLAVTRQDAMVVDDYYKEGKAINQDLRRDREAARLGMHAGLKYDPANGRLSGKIESKATPVTGPLQVNLMHSTLPERDLHLLAVADPDGKFSIALPMLERAQWQVLVENPGHKWRLTGTWTWPKEQGIALAPMMEPAD